MAAPPKFDSQAFYTGVAHSLGIECLENGRVRTRRALADDIWNATAVARSLRIAGVGVTDEDDEAGGDIYEVVDVAGGAVDEGAAAAA